MKKLLAASQRAQQDTARYMTRQLRNSALNAGWDADVVQNLHVVNEDGKFQTKVHPDYADRAFVHEFGNETTRPTAAIRKFGNDGDAYDKAFMVSLKMRWKQGQ